MSTLEEMVYEASSALDTDAIFGRPEGGTTTRPVDRKQRRVQYWRKADHPGATDAGWIVTGPEQRTDHPRYQQFLDRGWKPLEKFGNQISGQNIMSQGKSTPMIWEATRDQRNRPLIWLKTLFDQGGLTYVIAPNDGYGRPGDYLIPATQLVSLGLHQNPEVIRVRPDLQRSVILSCPERCVYEDGSLRIFSGVDAATAQSALDMHMMVKHKESEGTRSVGQEIAKALEAAGGIGTKAEDIAAIVSAVMIATGQAPAPKEKPSGPKFPEGFPDETWSRQELMAYAAARNLAVSGLPDRMKANTQQWLDFVVANITAVPEEDPEPDLEEVFLNT